MAPSSLRRRARLDGGARKSIFTRLSATHLPPVADPRMFAPSSKKVLLSVLVLCFVAQTGLVYTDEVDLELSADAVEGRKLFHDGSCQVCHQLWGQGGFLGPDLTNSASRVDETRLASLLTVGSGQMPAFGYTPNQISQMRAFLTEIDRPDLGRGELRLGDPAAGTTPQAAFERAAEARVPSGDEGAGFELVRGGICATCHFPFQESVVGAPDLSTAAERLSDEEMTSVLTDGRPALGMPPPLPSYTDREREQVVAYLKWLNGERSVLEAETGRIVAGRSVDWSRLAWWEYR